MRIEPIDDPADPRVADYCDIQDAELRLRQGLFVAESRAVVRRLLTSARFRTRSVLLTAPALESLRGVLEAADVDAPVYLASHEVARAVLGFDFHRGCIALGERGVEPSLDPLVSPSGPRLVVALEDVSNPDNVGGVFRNARAFGADAILLSKGCADPLYRKAIRVSMGAALVTPFAHLPDWADGLARLHEAGYILVALTPDPSALDISLLGASPPLPPRVVLLLGAEGHGLSAETRAAADLPMRIVMAPGADSLNVATASAIALHRVKSAANAPR
jgi:tRNA G18 (ribose-2'-O)-methylase SpoU